MKARPGSFEGCGILSAASADARTESPKIMQPRDADLIANFRKALLQFLDFRVVLDDLVGLSISKRTQLVSIPGRLPPQHRAAEAFDIDLVDHQQGRARLQPRDEMREEFLLPLLWHVRPP